ncbi:MAG: 50S ribosomal protein L35 [Rickettsiaceae bacterium H1]|nr:50S ribosomal protein L35 [Rickettsiaceae bacterium H1]
MPKLKTKSGVKKRFRLTGTGKVRSAQSGKRHGMRKRSGRSLSTQKGTIVLDSNPNAKIIKRFLPKG